MITFGSVCSGIEAASVAWSEMGWKARWFSEIEAFPSALLKYKYPDIPNLGDMTKLPARILAGEVEAPNVLCGGTPCQAFSVAGLRNSLDDARGNLSLIFCEVANAIDTVRAIFNAQPAVIFWENVCGVLNTKDNAFGCFLAGLAGEDNPLVAPGGKWPNAGVVVGPTRTVAWRVLDAQYFGVAQRRRRVFVVASAREGFDLAGILFEFEGVRRDTAPRREAGEEVTPTIRAGATNGSAGHGARSGDSRDELIVPVTGTLSARNKWPADLAPTLNTHFGCKQGLENQYIDGGAGLFVMSHGQANAEISVDLSPTLNCNHEQPIAFCLQHAQIGRKDTAGPQGKGWLQDLAFTQDSRSCADAVAFTDMRGDNRGSGVQVTGDIANTLHCAKGISEQQGVAVAFDLRGREGGAQLEGPHDTANIRAASGGSSRSYVATAYRTNAAGQIDPQGNISAALNTQTDPCAQILHSGMQVRRLTPRECERLQGFEDDYSLIPVKKVSQARLTSPNGPGFRYREIDGEVWQLAANGPRYKALGNSWAVPVVRWLGGRIDRALAEPVAETDSLESLLAFFDVPDTLSECPPIISTIY